MFHDRNIAEKIWSRLPQGNFDIYMLCISILHPKMTPVFSQFHNVTRISSGDEIADVNFLYDNIVHVLQNTIDSCINSATNRRGYVL